MIIDVRQKRQERKDECGQVSHILVEQVLAQVALPLRVQECAAVKINGVWFVPSPIPHYFDSEWDQCG